MSARVQLQGMTELLQALTTATERIREEAMDIVRDETEQAAKDIVSALPRKTGTLRSRVRTFYPAQSVLVGIVRSAAPHSHLYEFGTKLRRTRRGASRGVMPANPVTPKIAQTRRKRMYRRLMDLVRSHGFEVKGNV